MFELGPGEQSELLGLARRTLEFFFEGGSLPSCTPGHPLLWEPAGVFVSLHRHQALRGCVGRVSAAGPLYRAVSEVSLAAAFDDPRFPPLRHEELKDLEIEISVLSELVPARRPDEIDVGRHGLMITLGRRRGLLLPQVASQQGWSAARFLEETCRKAGLVRDSWRRGALVEKFSAQVFCEATASGSRVRQEAG